MLQPPAAAKEQDRQQTDHQTDGYQAVGVKMNEIVAQPDFHTDGKDFPGHGRCPVFGKTDAAQGCKGRDDKVGRIGNGPKEEDQLTVDFPVELRQPSALID